MTGVDVERVSHIPVVRQREDIDAANASRLRDELTACLDSGADHLVLDLSATRYLDSAGVDMLFRLSERLRQRRARLLLVIPPASRLTRLAEIAALPGAVAIHDTVEEALDACRQETAT